MDSNDFIDYPFSMLSVRETSQILFQNYLDSSNCSFIPNDFIESFKNCGTSMNRHMELSFGLGGTKKIAEGNFINQVDSSLFNKEEQDVKQIPNNIMNKLEQYKTILEENKNRSVTHESDNISESTNELNKNEEKNDKNFLGNKKERSIHEKSQESENEKIGLHDVEFVLSKLGRKKKNNPVARKHNKYSKDNIIIKIKTFIIRCIREALNESFIEKVFFNPKINGFLGLSPKNVIKNYKNEYNEELLNKTIKEIFSEDISSKYKSEKDHNKKLIEKIFRENLEHKVIKLLNIKLKDFLDIFRGQANEEICKNINVMELDKYSVNVFLEKLFDEEKNTSEVERTNKYLFNAAFLCFNFERFFKLKKDKEKEKQKRMNLKCELPFKSTGYNN